MRHIRVTINDCEVQTFRCGGKGGQNKDKRDTGVRIIHHPSGARGESREERSQIENKKRAFRRMAMSAPFVQWSRDELGLEVIHLENSTERIRTYNFIDNWVKDHRTGKTADLGRVLAGNLELLQ